MRVQSISESISLEAGIARIAFDLQGSEAGYLLISLPEGEGVADAFFGHDHYVEVKDQLFGRYGGLASLKIGDENELAICLTYEVAGVGKELTVVTRKAMRDSILSRLKGLVRHSAMPGFRHWDVRARWGRRSMKGFSPVLPHCCS